MSRMRLFVAVAGLILSLVAIGTGIPWVRWLAIAVLAAALIMRLADRRNSQSGRGASYNATDGNGDPEGPGGGGSSNT
jgi:membrane protein implicated in regulation of membrane protease activity